MKSKNARAPAVFLFALVLLLSALAPALNASGICEVYSPGVQGAPGDCSGAYEECAYFVAGNEPGCIESCESPTATNCRIEYGSSCDDPTEPCGLKGQCLIDYFCAYDWICANTAPDNPNYWTGDCGKFDNNEAGCRKRGDLIEPGSGFHGNCVWTPATQCNVRAAEVCTGDYTASGGTGCCVSSSPFCVNFPLTNDNRCSGCIPEGSTTLCSATKPCCNTPVPLVCDANQRCTRLPNQPPPAPSAPYIETYPPGSVFYTDGNATCTGNCPPNPVPKDPETGSDATMQYRWVKNGAVEGWSASAGVYSCEIRNCVAGDGVRLESRACDSAAPQACSTEVRSNSLLVITRPPPQTPPPVCGNGGLDNVMSLSLIGAAGVAVLVALAYMAGEFFQNPRAINWAKTEALQVFLSIIIIGAVIGTIHVFCSIQIGEAASIFTPLPKIYQGNEGYSLYQASELYLGKLMDVAQTNARAIRYIMGAYEIRTSYSDYTCEDSCWINLAGFNFVPYGGETMNLSLSNNLLSTATVSYLTAIFMFFNLQYILHGLFLVFLPLALVLRSVPFMRQFAGSLIAICISLYLLYPLMLVANSAIAPGLATPISGSDRVEFYLKGCKGVEMFTYSSGANSLRPACIEDIDSEHQYDEENLRGSVYFSTSVISADVPYAPRGAAQDYNSLADYARANALVFVMTVFLGAFDFIVIAAFARGISRILGEDVDIGKLGQMI